MSGGKTCSRCGTPRANGAARVAFFGSADDADLAIQRLLNLKYNTGRGGRPIRAMIVLGTTGVSVAGASFEDGCAPDSPSTDLVTEVAECLRTAGFVVLDKTKGPLTRI